MLLGGQAPPGVEVMMTLFTLFKDLLDWGYGLCFCCQQFLKLFLYLFSGGNSSATDAFTCGTVVKN